MSRELCKKCKMQKFLKKCNCISHAKKYLKNAELCKCMSLNTLPYWNYTESIIRYWILSNSLYFQCFCILKKCIFSNFIDCQANHKTPTVLLLCLNYVLPRYHKWPESRLPAAPVRSFGEARPARQGYARIYEFHWFIFICWIHQPLF